MRFWVLTLVFLSIAAAPAKAAAYSPILKQTKRAEAMLQRKQYAGAQQLLTQQLKLYPNHVLQPFWVHLLGQMPQHFTDWPAHVKQAGMVPHYYWAKAMNSSGKACRQWFSHFAQTAHQSKTMPVIAESTEIQDKLSCITPLPESQRLVFADILEDHRFFWLVPRVVSQVSTPGGYFAKGKALMAQRSYSKASEAFVQFLERSKGDAHWNRSRKEAVLQLGFAQRYLRNYSGANEWWKWIAKNDAEFYPEVLFAKAEMAASFKQTGLQEQLLTTLYRQYPKHEKAPEALWELVKASSRPMNSHKLIKWAGIFEQLYPEAPDLQAARFWSAQALERLGQRSNANQVYARVSKGPLNDFYTHIARCKITGRDCFKPVYTPLAYTPPYLTFVDRNPPLAELLDTKQHQILKVVAPFVSATELERDKIKSYAYLKNGNYFRSIRTIWRHKTSDKQFLRLMYPLHYPEIFKANAQRYGLPWGLTAGLAWQESMYKADIRSPSGALGLMQMMPATGREVARQLNIKGYSTRALTNPKINVQMGSYYLSQQLKRFNGDLVPTVAGYNGGPNAVARWMRTMDYSDKLAFIENIPYDETRRYVKQVLTHYWVYNEVYGVGKQM